MSENIGNLYITKVPNLSDTADIQEAFRLYHYGASTNDYAITNTDPSNLVNDSIAYHLYNLQTQITNFDSGIPLTAWTEKGVLISASEPSVPRSLSVGADDQVLTANASTVTGLEWKVPQVTLLNTVTISNKTFTNAAISDGGLKFNAPTGNSFTTLLKIVAPTTNRTINLPDADTTLVGTDTIQTLTNKTMDVGQLSGQVPIAKGGTAATTADNARSNLGIFKNSTSSNYSGKIFVADPTVVGATGSGLSGAVSGDLWFW